MSKVTDEFNEIYEGIEGHPLNFTWSITKDLAGDNYELRKEAFFEILEILLKQKYMKLAKYGHFLEGEPDEQLLQFEKAFPKTEAEMEDGIWFFDEICPGGAVWIQEDGTLYWT